jgi:Fibronectin type III domain
VASRHHRAADSGRVRVSVDGAGLPYGLLDPTLGTNQAYQVYQHGTVTLDRGLHWLRFTLVGQGHLGGTTIAPDHLTLIGGGGRHELVGDAVVDDESIGAFAIESGAWSRSTGQPGHPYYGVSYRSAPAGAGERSVSWRPDVPVTDTYQVLVWYVSHPNRASDAPYTIHHADGTTTVRIDQRGQARSLVAERPGVWVNLGSFRFEAGQSGVVRLTNDADGFVVADAVTLTRDPVPPTPTGLAAEPASPTSIALRWQASDGATGYHVERRVAGAGAWELAGTVAAGVTTLDSTGLTPATAYEHRVYAVVTPQPGRPARGSLATMPVAATTQEL